MRAVIFARKRPKLLEKIKRVPELAEFVIQGVNKEGVTFRPSNWNERLSDMLSTTGKDGRTVYSSYVHPATIQGISSVVVRFSLEAADPKGFEQVRQFIVSNELQVRAGRNRADAGETGLFPTLGMERRDPKKNGW
ncbi:MAG: DUF3579 domain-containing protein [Gammaproteobacteria bacterium]|nr:DUF3579 domain-containing protein [Sideroxydans sp.]MBU4045674.1 DUF3579 domain-containing protein [Gammaproteobacteria bacterium]